MQPIAQISEEGSHVCQQTHCCMLQVGYHQQCMNKQHQLNEQHKQLTVLALYVFSQWRESAKICCVCICTCAVQACTCVVRISYYGYAEIYNTHYMVADSEAMRIYIHVHVV